MAPPGVLGWRHEGGEGTSAGPPKVGGRGSGPVGAFTGAPAKAALTTGVGVYLPRSQPVGLLQLQASAPHPPASLCLVLSEPAFHPQGLVRG